MLLLLEHKVTWYFFSNQSFSKTTAHVSNLTLIRNESFPTEHLPHPEKAYQMLTFHLQMLTDQKQEKKNLLSEVGDFLGWDTCFT